MNVDVTQETEWQYWESRWRRAAEGAKPGSGLVAQADDWLERWLPLIRSRGARTALDLGCGLGEDGLQLHAAGLAVTGMDYSPAGIALARQLHPEITFVEGDLRDPLPFPDGSFDVVVSGFALHYFRDAEMRRIVAEVRRVLTPQGLLIARVNSTAAHDHGFGQGEEIEPRVFNVNGRIKRFFTADDVRKYLAGWHIVSLEHREVFRFRPGHAHWEVVALVSAL